MRIVEIIPDLSKRAGAETFIVNLSYTLSKNQKCKVWIVTLYNTEINADYKKILQDASIQIISFNKKKGIDISTSKALKKLLLMIKPDIVHTHLNVALSYFFAFGFKKQNWKWFHTIHNIARKEGSKIDRKIKKIYFKERKVAFIGISECISKTIVDYYGSKGLLFTIPNGIKLQDKDYSCDNKKYDIINVARFSEQKNHFFLLTVIKEICRSEKNFLAILVGDGPLKNKCQEYVEENNLNKNVIFVGEVNDVCKYLYESKIFVLPSRYEGNPISVLEAMNAALPIIASNVGGLPDIIKNGRNGFLLDKFDIHNYSKTILKLLKENDLYDSIACSNRSDVKQFSIEICSQLYLNSFKGS